MQDQDTPLDRRKWLVIVAMLAMCALPLLWPSVPPLTDLPGHMGSYAVSVADETSQLRSFYSFRWLLIGNLGVDLLIMPLAPIFGIELGSKIIAVAIPVALAAGYLMCAYEAHQRLPSTVLFALPLVYCYPYLFGFVNFCLGMALWSILVALFMRWTRTGQYVRRSLVIAIAAPIVWVTHAIPWFLLVATCGSLLAMAEFLRPGSWAKWIGRCIAGGLPLLTPLAILPFAARGDAFEASGWFEIWLSFKWALSVFRDRWVAFDLACTAVVGVVLLLTVLRRFKLRFEPRLLLIAVVLGAVFVLAPQAINDSAYVSARIVPYALAFALLAIDPSRVPEPWAHRLALCATTFFVVRIAGLTLSMYFYDRAYTTALSQLDHIPRYSRVVTFIPQTCNSSFANWGGSRMEHLGGMIVVRKQGFVNSEWTIEGLQLLNVHYKSAGDFQSDPSEFVHLEPCGFDDGRPLLSDALKRLPRSAFDYVWVLGVPALQGTRIEGMTPVATNHEAVLLKIDRT